MSGAWADGTKGDGDIAEMLACVFLMRDGFEVFRAASARQEYDIVAKKGESIYLIDVKKSSHLPRLDKAHREKMQRKIDEGVSVLLASLDGCEWYSKTELTIRRPA